MSDREKVIKGIDICLGGFLCSADCPYYPHDTKTVCMKQLRDDVLELLKMQEPRKKGYWKYPQSLDCCCSECGNQPDREPGESVPLYNYCPYCGTEMAVKWHE